MKKILYIMLAAVATIFAACTEDIDLRDIDDTTGILCVNGFLYSDCDSNVLYITKTGITEPKDVNNATVKMFVNGVLTEEKSGADSPSDRCYCLKTKFSSGDVVRVEVDCDGKHVWSEGTVPQCPKDLDVKATFVPDKMYYDDWAEEFEKEDMYRFDVSFTDISAERNYYRLYTKKDAYILGTRYEWNRWELDSVLVEWEGEIYYEYRYKDTTYREDVHISAANTELYINEAPELLDEEITANDEFYDGGIYNYYKVFKNSRFAGGKCNLRVFEMGLNGYDYNLLPPETTVIYDLADTATINEYNYTEYIGIESIDEDTYYYVKALNGFESGSFDNQELTGAVKMRRNVNGGSGNIALVGRTITKVVIYDHYKPRWVLKERDYYIDEDDSRYYDE